ncbi:MAG: AraC family transcriptional regulator [Ruminococcaceae bacterium]|nr:AraC family transcriptional regulator [Oscillospiraceae bacterium]
MSESICEFMHAKDYNLNIKAVTFVYEKGFHTLSQPFFYSLYRLHLVTNGTAVLKTGYGSYELKKGDVFFAFPASFYEMEGSEDLSYMYINFMGMGVPSLLEELDVSDKMPVYYNFDHLIDFWQSALARITSANSNILTESVLLYTLSFMGSNQEKEPEKKPADTAFEAILGYLDEHYRDSDISLKKISSVFSYTEKYLSLMFKKNMKVGFRTYLNRLRIQYAHELIESGITSVSQIASMCGYYDALYFSKVFKKQRGVTPSEYIKSR